MNCANYQRVQDSESKLSSNSEKKSSNMDDSSYGIEPSLIDRILRHYRPDFKDCAKSNLNDKGERFLGAIMFSFIINYEGDVSEVHMDESVKPFSMMECTEKVLRKIRFPKLRNNKSIKVTKPLNFAAKK